MRLISLLLAAMSLAAPTAQAQTPYTHAQTKAANLARMRAEKLNGGLRLYRTLPAMWTASSLPTRTATGSASKEGRRDGNSKVPLTQPSKPKC